MTTPAIAIRLAILGAGLVALWRGALMVDGDGAYDAHSHMLRGVLISAGVLGLLSLLLRRDRLSWRDIGSGSVVRNLRSFALGAGLWLLPALLGIALCTSMGWTSIDAVSAPGAIVSAALPLALAVFLVEALPEELALRGYVQSLVGRKAPAWVAVVVQVVVFTAFAWAVGALVSVQQWMFVPGLALILGYARAVSGSVWTGIGIHAAWMTTTQLMSPMHGHFSVTGMPAMLFVAFALLPSATIGAALGVLHPQFEWRARMR